MRLLQAAPHCCLPQPLGLEHSTGSVACRVPRAPAQGRCPCAHAAAAVGSFLQASVMRSGRCWTPPPPSALTWRRRGRCWGWWAPSGTSTARVSPGPGLLRQRPDGTLQQPCKLGSCLEARRCRVRRDCMAAACAGSVPGSLRPLLPLTPPFPHRSAPAAHTFPREAFELLLHINRAALSSLTALLYPLQSGRLALRWGSGALLRARAAGCAARRGIGAAASRHPCPLPLPHSSAVPSLAAGRSTRCSASSTMPPTCWPRACRRQRTALMRGLPMLRPSVGCQRAEGWPPASMRV